LKVKGVQREEKKNNKLKKLISLLLIFFIAPFPLHFKDDF
jgi:hypothetical protein